MLETYFHQYALISILAVVAFLVPIGMLAISQLFSLIRIRPYKPSPVKNSIYECGIESTGPVKWTQFNFRYYMYALLFVIFDVETIFIYPWAIQFQKLGVFALIEMVVFVFILSLGLLYAWRKRALDWE